MTKRCSLILLSLILMTLGCTFLWPESLREEETSASLTPRSDGAIRLTLPPGHASDQNAAYSPDGKFLVFTRFDNGYNNGPAGLYLLDLANRNLNRLSPHEDQDHVNLPGAAWSNQHNCIVFASDRLEADDLWCISPGKNILTRITSHMSSDQYLEPSWSPDGEWVVFEASSPGNSEDGRVGAIWKVRADGSELVSLTTDPGYDYRQPNWSPLGDQILFQRRHLPDGQWDIFTISPDGSNLRNITDNPSMDTDASWSPDGEWVVVSSDYGGLELANIFVYSVDTGKPVRVTYSSGHEDGAPSWSPDGKWIAFESHITLDEDSPSALWNIMVPLDSIPIIAPIRLGLIENCWIRTPWVYLE